MLCVPLFLVRFYLYHFKTRWVPGDLDFGSKEEVLPPPNITVATQSEKIDEKLEKEKKGGRLVPDPSRYQRDKSFEIPIETEKEVQFIFMSI